MPSSPSEIHNGGLARSASADVSFRNSGSGIQCGNMGDGPQNVNSGLGYQFNVQRQYIEWAACNRGLLWIKGKPGSGKSTLLKHVLRRVETKPGMGDESIILSFFFHGRGSELQKTPLGLFRSLLHHLLTRVPHSLSLLVDEFQQRCSTIGRVGEEWQWHARELRAFFESSLLKVLERRSVLLFVDALDECGEENAVHLVEYFKLLIKKLPPTTSRFRICFSCRHYPILELDYGSQICVEDENMRDIAAFTQLHVEPWESLCGRASSWNAFYRRHVEGEGLRRSRRKSGVSLQSWMTLYDELVRSMEDMAMSQRMIQWICFSTKPLSTEELRWAMAINPDHPHKSIQQCQESEDYTSDNETMERRIKTLSCGLAETAWSFEQWNPISTVQYIHQSVKDYFIKKGLSTLAALDGSVVSSSVLPLVVYAATSWVYHAKQGEAEGICQEDLLQNIGWPPEDRVKLWVRIYRKVMRFSSDCPSEGTSLLHVVSRYELTQLLSVILQKADKLALDINCRDSHGRTPLSWAAIEGHEAVVKLLLATDKVDIDAGNVDVNVGDYCGKTPLSYAAKRGNEDIVKLLLATDQRYSGQAVSS
ncbi:hypothetical protein BGZ61DRAFT_519619 [Ilyonectria robusta]|uniref:uncharacterized protein n=1 Tax=Ilyonectria robusta TaxID=1079257 RepID=UPI001E8E3EF9|nr:uncharacterized protein BGZ61DRAFT_519619 [Ilyonectria robusta]KAH8683989.1 hypothetical protein BGZ61DRAFT_519619 [Ilyonectria robusta]